MVVSERLFPTEQILTLLADAPARLAGLTQDLPPGRLLLHLQPGEWSVRDVLAHLRACSDLWGKYIRLILAEARPAIRAVSPRVWIRQTDYLELEFQPSLQAFTAQRAELLGVLEPLAPGDWERPAIVTGVGKPIIRTVHTYAERLAVHEWGHVRQIERITRTMRMLP